MTTRFHLGGAATLATALMILVGCQESNPNAPGRISGRVTFNGTAVTGGSVTFHYKDGSQASAPIAGDGSYQAIDIQTGETTVTVETESINPDKAKEEYRGTKGGPGGMAAKYGGKSAAGSKMMPKGKGMANSPAPDGMTTNVVYMKIPKKYSDPSTSGLTHTIEKGTQSKNFELTE